MAAQWPHRVEPPWSWRSFVQLHSNPVGDSEADEPDENTRAASRPAFDSTHKKPLMSKSIRVVCVEIASTVLMFQSVFHRSSRVFRVRRGKRALEQYRRIKSLRSNDLR